MKKKARGIGHAQGKARALGSRMGLPEIREEGVLPYIDYIGMCRFCSIGTCMYDHSSFSRVEEKFLLFEILAIKSNYPFQIP